MDESCNSLKLHHKLTEPPHLEKLIEANVTVFIVENQANSFKWKSKFLNLIEITVNFFLTSIVIEALKGVEPERRCFRMIGGVLVERTVKDVLPALENNKDQVNYSMV